MPVLLPRCQVTWNREKGGGGHIGDSALAWSVIVMTDTTARLGQVRVTDPQARLATPGSPFRPLVD